MENIEVKNIEVEHDEIISQCTSKRYDLVVYGEKVEVHKYWDSEEYEVDYEITDSARIGEILGEKKFEELVDFIQDLD